MSLEILYDKRGWGEITLRNTVPRSTDEQGFFWENEDQTLANLSNAIEGERATFFILWQGEEGHQHAGYMYLAPDYLWLGTMTPKAVTFGTGDLEQLRLTVEGGLHLGECGDELTVRKHELSLEAAEPGLAPVVIVDGIPSTAGGRLAFEPDPSNPGCVRLVAYGH